MLTIMRVDAHRLTGTGGAGDQDVRHLGQIRNGHLAGDVPAQGDCQRAFGLLELRGVDDLPD